MFEKTVIPAHEALQVICQRCGHSWASTSALYRHFVHCSQCGTTITINPIRARSAGKTK